MKERKKIRLVKKKIVADFLTPVAAYTCFKRDAHSFLFESVERGKTGRYSFIGLSPRYVYKLYPDSVKIFKRVHGDLVETDDIQVDDPLNTMQEIISAYSIDESDELHPFCGGLVGYLNYEIISCWENIRFSNPKDPDPAMGILMFIDEFISFDHLFNTADIVKLAIDNDDDTELSEDEISGRIEEIIAKLESVPESIISFSLEAKKNISIKSNFTREEFEKRVENIKEEIVGGEIIQGVFSQRLETGSTVDPFNYYRALRIINPSPYMFYLKLGDIILCGSSPEVLVRVEDRNILVRPIAGTRPRGRTPEEEKELAAELKSDMKEKAEHIMLVDLGRNDVGKVSLYGSVKVNNLMSIEKYSHVIHMVTDVTGRLKEGLTCVDVFKACFPAGTVSGAPKIRAIEIIEDQENIARGPYAGAVGYFSFTGDMDMCIAIRTMVIYKGTVYVQAGAGIVADSVPEKEYVETLNKAKALLEAVRLGESI